MLTEIFLKSTDCKRRKFAFYLSGLSGPTSQFLNGTHELTELVLARMTQLMDLLPLRSAKARTFGERAP